MYRKNVGFKYNTRAERNLDSLEQAVLQELEGKFERLTTCDS